MDTENMLNHSISPTTQTPTMTTKIDGVRMNLRCCVSPKTMATQAAGGLSSQSETRACHRQNASLRCGVTHGGFS